jgi:hypothetical protein
MTQKTEQSGLTRIQGAVAISVTAMASAAKKARKPAMARAVCPAP